jgi:hypothetical protein
MSKCKSKSEGQKALQPHLEVSVTSNPVPGNEMLACKKGKTGENCQNEDWSMRVPYRTTRLVAQA